MKRFLAGSSVIFTDDSGHELCRLTSETKGVSSDMANASIAEIEGMLRAYLSLVDTLGHLVDKAEKAVSSARTRASELSEDFADLADFAKAARDLLSSGPVVQYLVTMRSQTTGGADTLVIDVHPGQVASEIANRVATGYGAVVVSCESI